jgi:hypothetical protein
MSRPISRVLKDLVARDRRTAGEAGDRGVDLELREDVGERGDHRVVGGAAHLAGAAAREEVERGQRVGDVPGQLELLRARRQLARRLGSRLGQVGDGAGLDLLLPGPAGRGRDGRRRGGLAVTDAHALREVGDDPGRRHAVQHGPVEVGRGSRRDVDRVHPPVHRGLRHGRAPGTAATPAEGLLLGAVGVEGLRGAGAPPGACGQRLTPLLVVALLVVTELVVLLVGRRVVHHAEAHPELPQPLRNGVDGRGGDHQQPEDREQHEQRYGEDLAHGVRQRGRRGPADEAAGVPYRLHAVAAGGRAAGDVDLPEHTDEQRGQSDHDAAVGLGLLGVPDEPYGDDSQQDRHQQVEAAEGAGHPDLDAVADRAAQIGPGPRGDDQREAEQQQRDAVLAVGGVEVLRAVPYAAEHRSDGVGQTQPEGAHEPVDAPGGTGGRFGRRLGGRGFPGGRLLRRGLFGGGPLRRSLRGSCCLLGGLLLRCGGT